MAISADGNTAVVGGPADDCTGRGCIGAAWVFTRNGGVWSQQGDKLVGTGAIGGAYQGTSVAVSGDGNTVVVGGPGNDSSAGAVWVFTRSGGVWSQQGSKLVGSGAVGKAQQGTSVAISGDGSTIAFGGPKDDVENPGRTGAVWVFVQSAGVWSQQGSKLVGNDAAGPGDEGLSVAISSDGNTLIVGGPLDATRSGAAWVYARSNGVWSQQGSKLVDPSPRSAGNIFYGYSVAISGDGATAIVGEPGNAYPQLGQLVAGAGAGATWAYTRSGSAWSQQGDSLVGSGGVGIMFQGWSVAMSADGSTAAAGGVEDDSAAGAAWVFGRSAAAWSQQGNRLVGTGAQGASWGGYSVALSGDGKTVIAGGPADGSSAGAAWVFAAGSSPTSQESAAPAELGRKGTMTSQGRSPLSVHGLSRLRLANARPAASVSLTPPPQQFVLDFGVQTPFGTTSSLTEPVTPALDPGATFTIEFWLYLEGPSPSATLLGRDLPERADFLYTFSFVDSGTDLFLFQNSGAGGRGGTASATIPLRTWTHIAGTLDGQTLSLLVNGQVVSATSSPGPPASPSSSSFDFGPRANAALRQVLIWSRALTPAEIAANASEVVDPSSPGLVAYWPMDDGPGAKVSDLGPNHVDLQMPVDYTTDFVSPRWIHASVLETGPYFSLEPYVAPAIVETGGFIDFNHDGFLDILAVQGAEGSPFAFVNDGHGRFSDATSSVLGASPPTLVDHTRWVRVADFDHDGLMDCFIAGTDEGAHPDGTGGQARILMQKPGGTLVDETATRIPIGPTFTHSVALGDIDGTGRVDIFMGNIRNAVAPGPVFYMNDGAGHFTQDAQPSPYGYSGGRIPGLFTNGFIPIGGELLVDARKSGHPDLVLGRNGSHDSLLVNDGSGHFGFVPDAAMPLACGGPGWGTIDVATADFDGDGWPDLIVATDNEDVTDTCLQLFLNNGNGTFRDATDRIPPQNWTPGFHTDTVWDNSSLHEVEAVDLNGDGWMDFIAHGNGRAESRIYLNTGGGYFVDATDLLPMKTGAFFNIVSGDVDNDGLQDLLATSATPDSKGGLYMMRQLKPAAPALFFMGGPCTVLCGADVPASAVAGATVGFNSTASAVNCAGTASYDWDFGDAGVHSSEQNPTHSYTAPGIYAWTLVATAGGVSATRKGKIAVFVPGDVDGNDVVDVADVFYLINALFAGGPSPAGSGDANGDGHVDVSDVFYLINYLFAGGPAPK